MKYFYPLKAAVFTNLFLFLVPLFFILTLPNTFWFIALKVCLAIFMLGVFLSATKKYPEITLGAFIVFVGLLFTLWWFFVGGVIGWVAMTVLLLLVWAKLRFINLTEGKGMFSSNYVERKKRKGQEK